MFRSQTMFWLVQLLCSSRFKEFRLPKAGCQQHGRIQSSQVDEVSDPVDIYWLTTVSPVGQSVGQSSQSSPGPSGR
jgi:hypothetical protein